MSATKRDTKLTSAQEEAPQVAVQAMEVEEMAEAATLLVAEDAEEADEEDVSKETATTAESRVTRRPSAGIKRKMQHRGLLTTPPGPGEVRSEQCQHQCRSKCGISSGGRVGTYVPDRPVIFI
jgi:hypothetical protein